MTSLRLTAVSAGAGLALLVLGLSFAQPRAQGAVPYGTPEDVAYATALWTALEKERLVGPRRVLARPTKGEQPHGSFQQIVAATATVEGQERRVVVKANHRGTDLKAGDVYARPDASLAAFAVMAKREAGYDPNAADWFWVVFNPDGTLVEHQGVPIAGRADTGDDRGCIGCHRKYGGADFEMLTPQ